MQTKASTCLPQGSSERDTKEPRGTHGHDNRGLKPTQPAFTQVDTRLKRGTGMRQGWSGLWRSGVILSEAEGSWLWLAKEIWRQCETWDSNGTLLDGHRCDNSMSQWPGRAGGVRRQGGGQVMLPGGGLMTAGGAEADDACTRLVKLERRAWRACDKLSVWDSLALGARSRGRIRGVCVSNFLGRYHSSRLRQSCVKVQGVALGSTMGIRPSEEAPDEYA